MLRFDLIVIFVGLALGTAANKCQKDGHHCVHENYCAPIDINPAYGDCNEFGAEYVCCNAVTSGRSCRIAAGSCHKEYCAPHRIYVKAVDCAPEARCCIRI